MTIPDSVTSIGDGAFRNCTSLSSVTIPGSVTSIGDCAFYDCTSLSSMTIPDSVTRIGFYAFYGCSNLSGVTIPDSVSSIGSSAFYECTSLTSLTFQGKYTGEISTMSNYSWGIGDTSIIKGELDFTIFTFSDGTQEMYDWDGELSSQSLIDVGVKSDDLTWLKNPVEVRIG